MEYDILPIERQGAGTLVRLDRPQSLNALDPQVPDELIRAFAADERRRSHGLAATADKAEGMAAFVATRVPARRGTLC